MSQDKLTAALADFKSALIDHAAHDIVSLTTELHEPAPLRFARLAVLTAKRQKVIDASRNCTAQQLTAGLMACGFLQSAIARAPAADSQG